MFKGRCKMWKTPDGVVHAELIADAPKGQVVFRRSATPEDSVSGWDPNASGDATELVKKKLEYIAGFFPTVDLVGGEAVEKAQRLAVSLADDEEGSGEAVVNLKKKALEGDDAAYDVDYALRRMIKAARASAKEDSKSLYRMGVESVAGDEDEGPETRDSMYIGDYQGRTEIGASPFRKLKKFVKKNPLRAAAIAITAPVSLPVMAAKAAYRKSPVMTSAVFPPAAAFALLRKAKKGNPVEVSKVTAIRRIAAGLPPVATAPVPAPQFVVQAQGALENLRDAEAIEQQYEGSEIEPSDFYPDEEYYEGEEFEEYYGEDVIGANPFKKLVKKAKSYVDPTTKEGAWLKIAAKSIPGVGPGVAAGIDLVVAAKAGDKAAKEKIKSVNTLSKAGVPKAEAAAQNIQTANQYVKAAESSAKQTGLIAWIKRLFGFAS